MRLKGENSTPGGGRSSYMFQRKLNQKQYAHHGISRADPYKKNLVASASLPGIDKADSLSGTPSYGIRRAQGGNRLSPMGNLHSTQSPPLSQYKGFRAKRGSMQNMQNDLQSNLHEYRYKNRVTTSNSGYNSLPTLQVPSVERPASNTIADRSPSRMSQPNEPKPEFKEMLSNTLPNSNLSVSELNKINDLHNRVLNQQLA